MKQTNSESLSIKKKFQLFSLSVHKNLDRLIPILFILLATVIAFVRDISLQSSRPMMLSASSSTAG